MSLSGTDVFARLLDASPSAIVVADLRGRVVLLNEAAQRLLRYGARDVKGGLHVADLYHRRTDARLAATRLKARPVGVHPLDEPLDVFRGDQGFGATPCRDDVADRTNRS